MDANKTIKEVIVERYGSLSKFIDVKTVELQGKFPMSRQHFYDLVAHFVENPGIKTLNSIADMLGIDREIVYKEFSD